MATKSIPSGHADLREVTEACEAVDAERAFANRVTNHPDVQMLLSRIVELEADVMDLRSIVSELQAASDQAVAPVIKRALLHAQPLRRPVSTLAQVVNGVRRYIADTANLGYAARRLPVGDIVMDLESADLRRYLPLHLEVSVLTTTCRSARGYTRRINKEDREFMDWGTEPRKFAFVFRAGGANHA